MLIAIMIILGVIGFILLYIADSESSDAIAVVSLILMLASIGMLIFRMFSWICEPSKDRRYTSRCYNCC